MRERKAVPEAVVEDARRGRGADDDDGSRIVPVAAAEDVAAAVAMGVADDDDGILHVDVVVMPAPDGERTGEDDEGEDQTTHAGLRDVARLRQGRYSTAP